MNPPLESEEEKKTQLRLRSLYDTARILGAAVELEEAYPKILGCFSQQLSMKRGATLVLNAESGEWEIAGAHSLSAEEMKKRKEYFGSGVVERMLEKGQMAAVLDGGEGIWIYDGKAKTLPKRTTISFFCAPVKIQGFIAAVVGVDRLFENAAITDDFSLLAEVCALIGDTMMLRKAIAAENRALLEENWTFRKELENLGRSVPKVTRRIPLTEILEDRLARMIVEMKVDPRSNGRLYDDVLYVVERTLLRSALEKTKHVQLKTARFLGINRNTLRRKIKELGITTKGK